MVVPSADFMTETIPVSSNVVSIFMHSYYYLKIFIGQDICEDETFLRVSFDCLTKLACLMWYLILLLLSIESL